MSDVFISYSRKDIAFARLIWESLKQSQVEPWIDWERIGIGQKWWTEICEAIDNANAFLFIISNNSINSDYCRDEIDHAVKNHKRIIPVLVDDIKPDVIQTFAPDLPQINWIIFDRDRIFRIEENPAMQSDKREDNQVALPLPPYFDEALQKLNVAIHTDWAWVKYHTRLQLEALLWESNQRNPSYLIRGSALEESEQQLLRSAGKDPQPTGLQVEYVTASRKEETQRQQEQLKLEKKARQRQRAVIWTVGIGLVVAVVLGVVAWGQRDQYLGETHVRATAEANAIIQRATAQAASTQAVSQGNLRATAEANAIAQRDVAVSRQLAAQALNLVDKRFDLALLLGLEADRRSAGASWAAGDLLVVLQTSPRLIHYLRGHTNWVNSVAFSPDGKMLASGSNDDTIILWDVSQPEAPKQIGQPLKGHTSWVESIAFSPDGKMLASGSNDDTIILWDVSQPEAPKQIGQPLKGHTSWVASVAFSPDGKTLASGSEDHTIILWDVSQPEAPRLIGQPLKGHTSYVISVAFSPDGKTLASGGRDNTIILWNVSQPEAPKQLGEWGSGLTNSVNSLAFSPDGKTLAIGGGDNTIVLWDVSQPEAPNTLSQTPTSHNGGIDRVAFSPDGKTLATGGYDGSIVLLDVSQPEAPKQIDQPLTGHTSSVMSVAFSPNGKTLASGSADHTIILWDIERAGGAQTHWPTDHRLYQRYL